MKRTNSSYEFRILTDYDFLRSRVFWFHAPELQREILATMVRAKPIHEDDLVEQVLDLPTVKRSHLRAKRAIRAMVRNQVLVVDSETETLTVATWLVRYLREEI